MIANTRTGTVVEVVANAQGAFRRKSTATAATLSIVVSMPPATRAPATTPGPGQACRQIPRRWPPHYAGGVSHWERPRRFFGANQIQTGVAPGTIDAPRCRASRSGLLGGHRWRREDYRRRPSGVGQTLARGQNFDLAVNSGGGAFVQYEKAALTAHSAKRICMAGFRLAPMWS
jgi:hypothetical protein